MSEPQSYFDLQVNGYGGVDFNQDELNAEELHRALKYLEKDGVVGVLATIITEHIDTMARRIANLRKLRDADPLAARIIRGVHIEGPFLNGGDGYRGAHPIDAIRPADPDLMKRLLDAAGGLAKLVTLAPECDPGLRVTAMLSKLGLTVAAGHSNASGDELRRAIDAGLSVFTHLGNGCPMQMHRHDNIVQRALSLSSKLWLGFIADGEHVPFFALSNYIRAAGIHRCFIVTDAIAPASLGPGRYTVSRWRLDIGPDLVARAPDRSHLIGSAITMKQSARNLTESLGLAMSEVHRLTNINPRAVVKLS